MRFSRKHFLIIVALALFLAAFYAFVKLVATRDILVFMGVWNIDKIAHIAGGIFIAVLYDWILPRKSLPLLLALASAIAIGWELMEFLFDPDVIYFAHHSPDLWRIDVAGDITAAILGAYGYWVFFKNADSRRLVRRSTRISF